MFPPLSLQKSCEKLQQEKQTTESQVDELKKRVADLMERVQALRERERVLVAFPELNNWARALPQSMQLLHYSFYLHKRLCFSFIFLLRHHLVSINDNNIYIFRAITTLIIFFAKFKSCTQSCTDCYLEYIYMIDILVCTQQVQEM